MRQGCGTSDHSLFVCRLTLQALVFFGLLSPVTPFPTTNGGHAWNLHRRLAFGFCSGAASAPQAPPVSVPATPKA
jgi:hypothetical protein